MQNHGIEHDVKTCFFPLEKGMKTHKLIHFHSIKGDYYALVQSPKWNMSTKLPSMLNGCMLKNLHKTAT
jgi:hypothetical protein